MVIQYLLENSIVPGKYQNIERMKLITKQFLSYA